MLRLVAGLETVSAGTIRIGERVVNDLPPQARNVAMVFQDYALYPYLSARGNLEFPLRMRRMPPEERRRQVERIADVLDIRALLERLPRQLSGPAPASRWDARSSASPSSLDEPSRT